MDWSTNFIEQARLEDEADELIEDIIKQYNKYNIHLNLTKWWFKNNRFVFKIKVKGNTRETHIRANAPDVQLRLKLPLFYVVKKNLSLYFIASRQELVYSRLPAVLSSTIFLETQKQTCLPYALGHSVLGEPIILDLAKFPHLLLGGSTNSGKSVGLQALISGIAYGKSPSQVNFVLVDVGATDLMPFNGLPHLSCPVVRNRITAMHTLTALTAEMERRIELEYANHTSFKQLPRLIVVIDEFPALFMGVDKAVSKAMTNDVSALLQRGRHAKIHMVLAAQNPAYQNMKVDLGNITVRIAFKCAKKNFSETILGEGGAENLLGCGDLLLRSPQYDCPQRIQGIYITSRELRQIVQRISSHYCGADTNKFVLALPRDSPTGSSDTLGDCLSCSVVKKWPSQADQLLASVIVWALERSSISINMLMTEYRLGWNKASCLVKRLEELGIVDRPEGKLPRKVIPSFPEDIPEELKKFLQASGYSESTVISACYGRDDD